MTTTPTKSTAIAKGKKLLTEQYGNANKFHVNQVDVRCDCGLNIKAYVVLAKYNHLWQRVTVGVCKVCETK